MDLTTLGNYLQDNSLIDEEDFYEKILSIFQNAVDFNSFKHEDEKDEKDEKLEKDGEKDEKENEDGKEDEKDDDKDGDKEVEKEVEKEEDPLIRRLVSRSSHLVQYAKWLCLESLPVVPDKDRENR